MAKVTFTLNGQAVTLTIDEDRTLLWVLRTDLALTGTKYGCGEGLCGACTVLVNGEAQPSCQIPATSVNGAEIVTIEGLQRNGCLHPVQEAFIAYDALQCGYCTPGMILKAHSLLARNPQPTEEDIAVEMDDNLCRCGSHLRIVQAIMSASKRMQKGVQE